jgi:LysM domain
MSNYTPASRMVRPVAPVSKRQLNPSARRFLRTATVVAVSTVAVVGFLTGQAANAGSTATQAHFNYVTIHSGESLWQLANQVAPDQDPRDFIAKVIDLNNLTSADVVAGQRIALP